VPGCIFDGVSPTTRAHIFREAWIRDLTSSSDVLRHVLTRREPGDEFEREWLKERADFKVNWAGLSVVRRFLPKEGQSGNSPLPEARLVDGADAKHWLG
jgi:hypothetical protein